MKIGKIKFSIYTFQFAISNIITRHGGTGATRQWTPRVNGRYAAMDVSRRSNHLNDEKTFTPASEAAFCM